MTTSLCRGRSTSMFFRLCTRAPRTAIQSWDMRTSHRSTTNGYALPMLRLMAVGVVSVVAFSPTVTTLVGTGADGFSDVQVNNPYGMTIGPDGAMYFCDLDNQRIRRLDLATKR